MGVKERKEREKKQRSNDILEAARAVFEQKGFLNTTLQDVSKEAEISVGLIYRYFESKEDMFASLALKGAVEFDKDVKSILKKQATGGKRKSSRDVLTEITKAFFDFYEPYGEYFDLLLYSYKGMKKIQIRGTTLTRLMAVTLSTLDQVKEFVMHSPEFHANDEDAALKVVFLLWATLLGTHKLFDQSGRGHLFAFSAEEFLATSLDQLMTGIANPSLKLQNDNKKPIQDLPKNTIRAIFSDLDDTMTLHGTLPAKTYDSMWKWKESGRGLVIVSGRPAGWADALMRLWPIDAMVFENGAGYFVREGKTIRLVGLASNKNLQEQREILRGHFERIQRTVPAIKLAKDQPYRIFDYAIDFAEDEPFLDEASVARIMEYFSKITDVTAKLSSIHVNYWCGEHTKITALEHWIKHYGAEKKISGQNLLYCGDSPNDEPLFQHFPLSVGVANVEKFLPKMKYWPTFFTKNEGGDGFAELVNHLL